MTKNKRYKKCRIIKKLQSYFSGGSFFFLEFHENFHRIISRVLAFVRTTRYEAVSFCSYLLPKNILIFSYRLSAFLGFTLATLGSTGPEHRVPSDNCIIEYFKETGKLSPDFPLIGDGSKLKDCREAIELDMEDYKLRLERQFEFNFSSDTDLRKIRDFFLFLRLKSDEVPLSKEKVETLEKEFLDYMLLNLVPLRSFEEDQMSSGFLEIIHKMDVNQEELMVCFKQYVVTKNLLDSKTFYINFSGADKLDCETKINAVLKNLAMEEFKVKEPSPCRPTAKFFDTMLDEFIVQHVFTRLDTTEDQKKTQLLRLKSHFTTFMKYFVICSIVQSIDTNK